MQADPCVSSNAPRLVQVEIRVTPVRFCFFARGGASVRGAKTMTQGFRYFIKIVMKNIKLMIRQGNCLLSPAIAW